MGSLTSSMSSRETFLLQLLALDAEPDSALGASTTGVLWGSPCKSCEASEDGSTSAHWGSFREIQEKNKINGQCIYIF